MSSLKGKLEANVVIRAPPETIIRAFRSKPNELTNICPDIIRACDLVEGEWGKLGSVTHWNYVIGNDGHTKSAKLVIQSVDSANKSISYGVVEGDLMDEFSSFTAKVEAGQTAKGGSLVHLTLSYVKRHEDVAHPETMLQLGIESFKGLDSFLTH